MVLRLRTFNRDVWDNAIVDAISAAFGNEPDTQHQLIGSPPTVAGSIAPAGSQACHRPFPAHQGRLRGSASLRFSLGYALP